MIIKGIHIRLYPCCRTLVDCHIPLFIHLQQTNVKRLGMRNWVKTIRIDPLFLFSLDYNLPKLILHRARHTSQPLIMADPCSDSSNANEDHPLMRALSWLYSER